MTERISSVTVFLEEPMRIDDAKHILTALRMVTGVMRVEPNEADGLAEYTGALRAKTDLWAKVTEAFWGKDGQE